MAFRASALRSAWSRVHFPRQTVTLVRSAGPDKGIFKVDPKMTKLEVREYLEKVYGLPVRKVNTTNYDGKLEGSNDYALQSRSTCTESSCVVSLTDNGRPERTTGSCGVGLAIHNTGGENGWPFCSQSAVPRA